MFHPLWKVDQRHPQRREGRITIKFQELLLIALNHGLEHDEMGLRDNLGWHIGDGCYCLPVVHAGVGIFESGFFVIAQSESSEACSEAGHALVVFLRADPRRGLGLFILLPPTNTVLAFSGSLVPVYTPYHGTHNMHLSDEDVDPGEAFPSKIGKRKNMASDNANSISSFRGNTGFINKLRDYCFGEYIKEIEQEGRGLGFRELGPGSKK